MKKHIEEHEKEPEETLGLERLDIEEDFDFENQDDQEYVNLDEAYLESMDEAINMQLDLKRPYRHPLEITRRPYPARSRHP